MDTDTKQASFLSKLQIPGGLPRIGTFILHFVEMVLVMCAAGAGLTKLISFGIAQADNPNLIGLYPRLSILMIGIHLAIPMAAWMRIRGHEWRPTLEMASTSILLAILLVFTASLGFMENANMFVWFKRLACPVMLIPMFYRIDLYTVHHGHHREKAHTAPPVGEHSGHANEGQRSSQKV